VVLGGAHARVGGQRLVGGGERHAVDAQERIAVAEAEARVEAGGADGNGERHRGPPVDEVLPFMFHTRAAPRATPAAT
jgi:hypothetical protein